MGMKSERGQVTPMHDLVLLEVLEDDTRTSSGGIVYAQQYDKTCKRARVLKVGPGRTLWKDAGGHWHSSVPTPEHLIDTWSATKRVRMDVEPGDYVLYQDHRTRWHSGGQEWPQPGDEALVPMEAMMFKGTSLADLDGLEVGVLGVTR